MEQKVNNDLHRIQLFNPNIRETEPDGGLT